MPREGRLSSQRYVDLLTRLLPAGAVGVTLALGSAAPSQASAAPQAQQPPAGERVSDRLAAIREAVSLVVPPEAKQGTLLAQWWGNYPWNNWRNWGNGWNNYWRHRWHNWW